MVALPVLDISSTLNDSEFGSIPKRHPGDDAHGFTDPFGDAISKAPK